MAVSRRCCILSRLIGGERVIWVLHDRVKHSRWSRAKITLRRRRDATRGGRAGHGSSARVARAARHEATRRARPRCRPRSPWPTDLYYTRGTGPAYTSLDPQAILGRAKSERATPRPRRYLLCLPARFCVSSCVSETSSVVFGAPREIAKDVRLGACVRA